MTIARHSLALSLLTLSGLCASCSRSAPPPNQVVAAPAAALSSSPAAAVSSASAPSDPCRGKDLDADQLAEQCRHDEPAEPRPKDDGLRIELQVPAQGIASAGSGVAVVSFGNVSPGSLVLKLDGICGEPYEVSILGADGRRVDIENEMGGLGLCDTVPGIRVELEPGGVLRKRLEVSGRARRWVPTHPERKKSPLRLGPGSPIPPGEYTLQVRLPLYGEQSPGSKERREVSAPLRIVGP